MKQYCKGSLGYAKDKIAKQANDGKNWAYWHNEIFDLSDYIYALQCMNQASNYLFLHEGPTISGMKMMPLLRFGHLIHLNLHQGLEGPVDDIATEQQSTISCYFSVSLNELTFTCHFVQSSSGDFHLCMISF
jgi:hypothetical protein